MKPPGFQVEWANFHSRTVVVVRIPSVPIARIEGTSRAAERSRHSPARVLAASLVGKPRGSAGSPAGLLTAFQKSELVAVL
jgi:hypothetical protein